MSILNHMNQSILSSISSLIFLRNRFDFFSVGITTACVNYAHFKHLKEKKIYFQKEVVFIAFPFRRHMLVKHKSAALLMFPWGQFLKNILKLAEFD